MKIFIKHATSKDNLTRAIRLAIFIGTILALINHYDMFLEGNYETSRIVKMALTYLVPFGVSLYSSAMYGRQIELSK